MSEATLQPRISRQNRDRYLVEFIARYGVVTMDHVMAALGVRRAAAYRRTSVCIEASLLERFELMRFEPSLLRATRLGLRYVGMPLPKARVTLASLDHRLRCATTGQRLAAEFAHATILTERDLILAERLNGHSIAGARVIGQHSAHRPDLAVLHEGRTIAVELELSPKGPSRLEPLLQAWNKSTSVSEVLYFCEPGTTRRGVERIVDKLGAHDRIKIFDAPIL